MHRNVRHWTMPDTPVGELTVVAEGEAVIGVYMSEHRDAGLERGAAVQHDDLLQEAAGQLDDYFAGKIQEFQIPTQASGTDFQMQVWAELSRIPYGSTISYGELASRVGRPRAVRAVGAANGRNPLSILVPCHRVVGADGSLTGYGGGVPNKRALLALEGALAGSALF